MRFDVVIYILLVLDTLRILLTEFVFIISQIQRQYTNLNQNHNPFSERDSIECTGQSFQVSDARGQSVFQASRDEVKVFSDAFTVNGVGGLAVKSAVQTPVLKAPYGSDLV